jgi:hypothetical protein
MALFRVVAQPSGPVAQVAPARKGRTNRAQQFPETAVNNLCRGPVAQVDRAAVS